MYGHMNVKYYGFILSTSFKDPLEFKHIYFWNLPSSKFESYNLSGQVKL